MHYLLILLQARNIPHIQEEAHTMEPNKIPENLALNELMNHDGGIDADMVDVYFHSPELIKALTMAVKQNHVIWDEDRIHIEPNLFFAMFGGVAY